MHWCRPPASGSHCSSDGNGDGGNGDIGGYGDIGGFHDDGGSGGVVRNAVLSFFLWILLCT